MSNSPYPVKIPAFQFYPADWRKDPAVQALSYHDRGIWFEILCIMHESNERGKLLLNGEPMPMEVLSRLLGLDKQVLAKAIAAILKTGAAKQDEKGTLFSKRMVHDEAIRRVRHAAGIKGGHPLLKQKVNQMVNQEVKPPGSSPANQTGEDVNEVEDSSREGGAGGNPTLEEVLTYCNMGAGIGVECGTAFWNSMEACGWLDRASRPILKWQNALVNYSATWKANAQKAKTHGNYHNADKPNHRNAGLTGDAEERQRRLLETVKRKTQCDK